MFHLWCLLIMPHIMVQQAISLISSCLGEKHPPFAMLGGVWPNTMHQASANKCAWLNEQHEVLMSVNRWALKHIKQSAKRSQIRTGGKSLQIPIGNLVLLRDHPKGCNKIQDNYKSELFVIVDHHKDPNVYVIQSLNRVLRKQLTGDSCLT